MSATETHDGMAPGLDDQLAEDASGQLRDSLLDELFLAANHLETVLADGCERDEAEMLRKLLGAVRVAETVVSDAWRAFHG